MRKNRGITLIALVVTIIILVILAGVSMNILLGDEGIIAKAKETKRIQEVATILEKLELEKLEVAMDNEYETKLDVYLTHLQTEGIITEDDIKDPWNTGLGSTYITIDDYSFLLQQEGNNIKITAAQGPVILKLDTQVNAEEGTIDVNVVATNVTNGKYEYSIRQEGQDYTVEKVSNSENYTFEGLTKDVQYYIRVIVVDEDGNLDEEIKPVFTSTIQPGAYVSYNPIAKTFELTADKTGYESTQSFNTGDYKGLWRVLYNDTTNGLQIISEDSVGDLYLSGKIGYNKAIETLNEFCSKYEEETLSESSRVVGTDPTNPVDPAAGNVEFVVEFNGSKDSGLKQPDTKYTTDYQAMSQLGIHDIGSYYWLGNRKVYHDSEVGYFSIYTLASGGNVEYRRMVDMYANLESGKNLYEYEYAYGVRPVIKFPINSTGVTSGTGEEGSPFVLGAK